MTRTVVLPDVKSSLPVFDAHQGEAGFARIRDEWLALCASLGERLRFNQLPDWYAAFLQAKACDPGDVWFVTVRCGGELAAVIPLQFQKYEIYGLSPRVLGTIDDDQMQLSDFILSPALDDEPIAWRLCRWLRSQKTLRWDVLRLRKVAADSSIASAMRARLPWATQVLQHDSSSYFDTHLNYEHASKDISGTFKRNLRRLSRRAEESAPLRHEAVDDPQRLLWALDQFLDIEASGWKGGQGTASAIRCHPVLLAFYRSLASAYSGHGARCCINLLWHGDRPVAGQFCLRVGRVLNVLKVGYREDCAHFAPGNLLLERIIRDACDEDGLDVVSLVNRPEWARTFKPLCTGVWSYVVPNLSVPGLMTLAGLRLKRALDARRARKLEQACAKQVSPTKSETDAGSEAG